MRDLTKKEQEEAVRLLEQAMESQRDFHCGETQKFLDSVLSTYYVGHFNGYVFYYHEETNVITKNKDEAIKLRSIKECRSFIERCSFKEFEKVVIIHNP